MSQATLTEYEGQTGPTGFQPDLPDREYSWQDESASMAGLDVVMPDVSHRGNPGVVSVGGDRTLRANEFGYVVGGLDEYLEQHRDEEIEIPVYYSRFEEEGEGYLGGVTAANGSFGVGATPRRLEAAVRAATGGGSFSASETEVIGCGKHPFIVRNGQGAFVFTTVDLERPDSFDLDSHPRHEVADLSVPEDVKEVRKGISFAKTALAEEFDIEIASHVTLSDGFHHFETVNGRRLRIKGYHLKRLSGVVRDAGQITGQMAYEDPWGETFEAEVTDVEYHLGRPMARRGKPVHRRPRNDRVVGFARTWFDPRRSSRVSLSSEVQAKMVYVRLQLSVDQSGMITADRETHTETVDGRRPENKREEATWKGI
ncbi:hypothetical protein [Halorhabdus rudnickae]|uniref:hypothetical protein n=1 Tax=Halorhabdus rudnickae TaxID=1775544 RepID=UPI001082DE53|nr:hypothetical protein [Halorhabdus rudnickae]